MSWEKEMQESCCVWPKCETELLDALVKAEQQLGSGQINAALAIIRAAIRAAT